MSGAAAYCFGVPAQEHFYADAFRAQVDDCGLDMHTSQVLKVTSRVYIDVTCAKGEVA